MPIAGIRISPLNNVPVIAPSVLIAYSKLMPVPLACPGDDTAALSSGSVMPIIAVGIARIANELTSRATVSTPNESGEAWCSAAYRNDAASSSSGEINPVTPTRISAMPNAVSGEIPGGAARGSTAHCRSPGRP